MRVFFFNISVEWILVSYDSSFCSSSSLVPEYHHNLANKKQAYLMIFSPFKKTKQNKTLVNLRSFQEPMELSSSGVPVEP